MDIREATLLLLLGNSTRKKKKKRSAPNANMPMDLVQMNASVESLILEDQSICQQASPPLPSSIWEDWLWKSDPNDPPTSDALLNRNQLLGLLICRYRAVTQPPCMDMISMNPSRLVVIQNKPPGNMTLRELRDTVTNITLLWGKDIHCTKGFSTDSLLSLLDSCFHRLGELAWATWPCGSSGSPISDDVGSIEVVRVNGNDHDQVSLSCIRSLICSFMVAYRLIHWMKVSDPKDSGDMPQDTPQAAPIHQHHVTASLDDFYKLAMFYDLPPASRLNYRHTFSGLYNCISQPVYFHNPDYQRRVQVPLHAVQSCQSDICTLPALLQIYPEVSVIYDDNDFERDLPQSVSALASSEKRYAFRWLVTSARVYLFQWDPKNHSHIVYREPDGNIINCLRRHYIPHKEKYITNDRPLLKGAVL